MTSPIQECEPSTWSPEGWRGLPIKQLPAYPDLEALEAAATHLRNLPPLVTSWEIERLRQFVAEAAEGKRFILQGGDCAELFSECTPDVITSKLKILLQMSLVLTDGLKRPIVRIGRFAGQYAKPRSSPFEVRGDQTLPSYFGDLINGSGFSPAERTPDPKRLLTAYHHAAMTLNFIRALIGGGFADLHHPEYWDLNFLGKGALSPESRDGYHKRVHAVGNAIELMELLTGQRMSELTRVDFYTSHEGLSLHYESALTRQPPRRREFYNLGCHLPWIGERTRDLHGAHVDYFRGIRNPIGLKIGPSISPEALVQLINLLDPNREPGDLVLIPRLGAGQVRRLLPPLLEAVRAAGHRPAWVCDPMHGNTVSTRSGRKTRHFDAVLSELIESIEVHEACGSQLSGVHFELTADKVTECLGGISGVQEQDLGTSYQTGCDPRLNYEQAMEIAFAIARRMEKA